MIDFQSERSEASRASMPGYFAVLGMIATTISNRLSFYLIKIILPAVLSVISPPVNAALALDPAYHSPEEIASQLAEWAEEYPEVIYVDSIGHGSRDGMTIYRAIISDNPGRAEINEPPLLFVGQVHAEEVLGVEVVLRLMRELLENHGEDPWRSRVEGLEMHFIPTANPEGLQVVHDGLDVTYRKNCRDNIGDGEFRYRAGVGYDTSGVDLNRNFPLHWDRGDSLFHGAGDAAYNYYRGPEPASESETQALIHLGARRRFLFSLVYHSSRSGNNAQMVIGPWSWDGRLPPDGDAINALGGALASRMPLQNGGGTYLNVRATQRNGQAQDWFYQALGTFQYMVEIGQTIQPDSALMERLVTEQLDAACFLMDLAAGTDTLDGFGILQVTALDGRTGNRLTAAVEAEGLASPVVAPRLTDPVLGTLWWLQPLGRRNITVLKRGYAPLLEEDVPVHSGGRTSIVALMQPVAHYPVVISLMTADNGDRPAGTAILDDGCYEPLRLEIPAGGGALTIPRGDYSLTLVANGYMPVLGRLQAAAESLNVTLYPEEIIFSERFEEFGEWQRGGAGQAWGLELSNGRICLTESVGGGYPLNASLWLQIDTGVRLDTSRNYLLRLIHRPYFEPGQDFGILTTYYEEDNSWRSLARFTGFPNGWDTTYIALYRSAPELKVRFEVESDGLVSEDGWLIDQLDIITSDAPRSVEPVVRPPANLSLDAFPNPANGMVTVELNLPQSGKIQLLLFDMNGRMVAELFNGWMPKGGQRRSLAMSELPSGVYFLQLTTQSAHRRVPVIWIR